MMDMTARLGRQETKETIVRYVTQQEQDGFYQELADTYEEGDSVDTLIDLQKASYRRASDVRKKATTERARDQQARTMEKCKQRIRLLEPVPSLSGNEARATFAKLLEPPFVNGWTKKPIRPQDTAKAPRATVQPVVGPAVHVHLPADYDTAVRLLRLLGLVPGSVADDEPEDDEEAYKERAMRRQTV